MGLFGSILGLAVDVVVLPVRMAIDIVELPTKVVGGDLPLQGTVKGLKDIKEDLID